MVEDLGEYINLNTNLKCGLQDGDLLTDFGERRCSSRSKASNLRHVLVFKGAII